MSETSSPPDVAANVRAEIARRQTTITLVADHAGIPRSTFTRRLAHPDTFTIGELSAIAHVLRTPFGALVRGPVE